MQENSLLKWRENCSKMISQCMDSSITESWSDILIQYPVANLN